MRSRKGIVECDDLRLLESTSLGSLLLCRLVAFPVGAVVAVVIVVVRLIVVVGFNSFANEQIGTSSVYGGGGSLVQMKFELGQERLFCSDVCVDVARVRWRRSRVSDRLDTD